MHHFRAPGARRVVSASLVIGVAFVVFGMSFGVLAVGADFPLRLLGTYDIFPRGRFTTGSIEGPDGKRHALKGGELGLTVRWGS